MSCTDTPNETFGYDTRRRDCGLVVWAIPRLYVAPLCCVHGVELLLRARSFELMATWACALAIRRVIVVCADGSNETNERDVACDENSRIDKV